MAHTYIFGHHAWYDEISGIWRYSDNNEPVSEDRACNKCNQTRTAEGHDPCIANLPGVKSACCGHGKEIGYIQFKSGLFIRGKFSIEIKQ